MADALPQCGFEGNADMYGLGVRVGFYLSLLSTSLASAFTSSSGGPDTTNVWFQLALSISLTQYTASNPLSEQHAIDNHILCLMLNSLVFVAFGKLFVELAGTHGRALRAGKVSEAIEGSALTMIWKVILILWLHSYSSWFWWKGLDGMAPAGDGCEDYTFFFAKVRLRGWYRTLNKVVSTWFLVGGVLGVVSLIVTRYIKMKGAVQVKMFRRPTAMKEGRMTVWEHILRFFDAILSPLTSNFNEYYNERMIHTARYTHDPILDCPGNEDVKDRSDITHERREMLLRREIKDFIGVYLFGALLSFVGVVMTIVAVELTLDWNSITEVEDILPAGQMIAFLLGAGSLLQTFKNLYLDIRRIKTEEGSTIRESIRKLFGLDVLEEVIALTGPVGSTYKAYENSKWEKIVKGVSGGRKRNVGGTDREFEEERERPES